MFVLIPHWMAVLTVCLAFVAVIVMVVTRKSQEQVLTGMVGLAAFGGVLYLAYWAWDEYKPREQFVGQNVAEPDDRYYNVNGVLMNESNARAANRGRPEMKAAEREAEKARQKAFHDIERQCQELGGC